MEAQSLKGKRDVELPNSMVFFQKTRKAWPELTFSLALGGPQPLGLVKRKGELQSSQGTRPRLGFPPPRSPGSVKPNLCFQVCVFLKLILRYH